LGGRFSDAFYIELQRVDRQEAEPTCARASALADA
jgi:hypothetical protein